MTFSISHLPMSSTNANVGYFGVSMMDKLANFHEEHWKDMFVKWQKRYTCLDGLE